MWRKGTGKHMCAQFPKQEKKIGYIIKVYESAA